MHTSSASLRDKVDIRPQAVGSTSSRSGVDRCRFIAGYLINVASARNGVGYGAPWIHLDGFSEHVIHWIAALEGEQ